MVKTQDAINRELENALCIRSIVLILMKHLHVLSFSAGFFRAPTNILFSHLVNLEFTSLPY